MKCTGTMCFHDNAYRDTGDCLDRHRPIDGLARSQVSSRSQRGGCAWRLATCRLTNRNEVSEMRFRRKDKEVPCVPISSSRQSP
jgi:hypothetical protein